MRRFLTNVLILVVAFTTLLNAQEQPKQEQTKPEESKKPPQVRREPPTVVTVEEKRSQVAIDESRTSPEEQPNLGKRIVRGTWKGIVSAFGWALNTDEDIPSDRERKDRKQEK